MLTYHVYTFGTTLKPVSKIDKTKVLNPCGSLMQVKSNAYTHSKISRKTPVSVYCIIIKVINITVYNH